MDELTAAGITDPRLRASYTECKRLNSLHGKTYYLATLLLPKEKRPFVHALYGFARYADEIVDDLRSTITDGENPTISCPGPITLNTSAGFCSAVGGSIGTPTANDNEFTLTTCWGPNYVAFLTGNPAFNGAFPYPGTLSVDPTSGVVTVVGGAGYATGGTGSMDACSGVITVTLGQGLFGSPFTTTVVYTPN